MSSNILVAYSSKTGTTIDVADFIGKQLAPHFDDVDVRPIALLGNIQSYDAVVVGSPILEGKYAPGVMEFLTRNRNHLSQVPVAYFFTCLLITRISDINASAIPIFIDPALQQSRSTEKSHALAHYLLPLVERVPEIKPVSIGFFKGRLDFKKLDFLSQMTFRLITMFTSEIREGDFVNWDVLREWTEQVYPALKR